MRRMLLGLLCLSALLTSPPARAADPTPPTATPVAFREVKAVAPQPAVLLTFTVCPEVEQLTLTADVAEHRSLLAPSVAPTPSPALVIPASTPLYPVAAPPPDAGANKAGLPNVTQYQRPPERSNSHCLRNTTQ